MTALMQEVEGINESGLDEGLGDLMDDFIMTATEVCTQASLTAADSPT